MLTKKVIFMCAQPDVQYFHWQVEVMIHNFIKHGINPNWIEVLFAIENNPSSELTKLREKYPYVRFFTYPRTVSDNFGYIPILRPDILEQHFTKYPELRGEVILYHDSDIIFRELPDFDSLHDDMYWYFSDTISYIGADYIKSKGDDLLPKLCELSNVDQTLVEANQENSGGAQYLTKGLSAEFWKRVKESALYMYKYMSERETSERLKLNTEELKAYNPIQKWCADMWAVYWTALDMGANVRISPELSFSWGSSSLEEYNQHNIMHNAGVTAESNNSLFFKGDFINKSPFTADFSNLNKNTASYKYIEAILYAKEQGYPAT